jgi:ankyrin repeat protein
MSKLQELLEAVTTGDCAALRPLLHRGNVNHRDAREGLTLLSWAVVCNHADVAAMLLDAGATLSIPDANGFTALHRAAFTGAGEMAELLLARGADVNAQSVKHRKTPLILAAMKDDSAMVTRLWARGADVEMRDSDGVSAVDHATFRGLDAVVAVLAEHGADCHAARYYCEEGVKNVATIPERESFEHIVKMLCAPWAPQSTVTVL